MPNLCGSFIQEAGENLTKDDELKLGWAASSVMGGGLDTVSFHILLACRQLV